MRVAEYYQLIAFDVATGRAVVDSTWADIPRPVLGQMILDAWEVVRVRSEECTREIHKIDVRKLSEVEQLVAILSNCERDSGYELLDGTVVLTGPGGPISRIPMLHLNPRDVLQAAKDGKLRKRQWRMSDHAGKEWPFVTYTLTE